MENKIRLLQLLTLILILTIFVTGRFSLSRSYLVEGFLALDVRYILFCVFCFLVLMLYKEPLLSPSRHSIMFIFILCIFLIYLIFSMFWLHDMNTGKSKFLDIIFLMLICLGLFFIIHIIKDVEKTAEITAYFFLLMGLFYLSILYANGLNSEDYRSEVYAGGKNVQTRVLFFAIVSSVFLFNYTGKYRYLALVFLFIPGIVLLGSKQGIIAAAFVLLLLLCLEFLSFQKIKGFSKNMKEPRAVWTWVLIIVASVVISMIFVKQSNFRFLISLTTRYAVGYYRFDPALMSTRDTLYEGSIQVIKEHPIWGIGLAGYNDIPTIGFYPHNIVLEVLLDGGIVAGVLFSLLVFFAFYIIFKGRLSIYLPFFVLPLYILICAMVSGDLYDFRYYFLWAILSLYFLFQHNSQDIECKQN